MNSNSSPLVSVRLMTYNHGAFIAQAIESCLMQETDFDFEIVIGDDFSTDNTYNICLDFERRYPNIIHLLKRNKGGEYWKRRQRRGRLINFIDIIENCRGKYIAFLDGDDYWTDPTKLEKQVQFLESNPDYAICYHDVELYDEDSASFLPDDITREVEDTTSILDLAKGNYIHTPSVVFCNDFNLPDWFISLPIGDWTLYMFIIGEKKVKRITEKMAVYRLHSHNIWGNKPQEYRSEQTKIAVQMLRDNCNFSREVDVILDSRLGNRSAQKEVRGKYFLKRVLRYFNVRKMRNP